MLLKLSCLRCKEWTPALTPTPTLTPDPEDPDPDPGPRPRTTPTLVVGHV